MEQGRRSSGGFGLFWEGGVAMTELGQFPPVVVYNYVLLKPIDYIINTKCYYDAMR